MSRYFDEATISATVAELTGDRPVAIRVDSADVISGYRWNPPSRWFQLKLGYRLLDNRDFFVEALAEKLRRPWWDLGEAPL